MPPPAGYVITSPSVGTTAEWQPPECRAAADCIMVPLGQHAGDTTSTTTETSEEARALYIGRADKAYTQAEVAIRVAQAQNGNDWSEVAILKNAPDINANVKLTRCGVVDATAEFGALGTSVLTITLTGVAIGTDLWIAWDQKNAQAGNLAKFVACLPDYLKSGNFQVASATRLSTMGADTQFTLAGDTVRGAWTEAQVQ